MLRITMAGLLCLSLISASSAQNGTPEEVACTPDVYRLCNAAIPDERKILACLIANQKNLSPACRRVVIAINN